MPHIRGQFLLTIRLWHLFSHLGVSHFGCRFLHSGLPPLHVPHINGQFFCTIFLWHLLMFHFVVHLASVFMHFVVVVVVVVCGATYNSLLGDPIPASVTTFDVAPDTMRDATTLGAKFGSSCNSNAAAPATCGHAMDVPFLYVWAVSLAWPVERIWSPGAKMSRQVP